MCAVPQIVGRGGIASIDVLEGALLRDFGQKWRSSGSTLFVCCYTQYTPRPSITFYAAVCLKTTRKHIGSCIQVEDEQHKREL